MVVVGLLGIFVISGCGNESPSSNSPESRGDNASGPASSSSLVIGDAMTFANTGRNYNFGDSNKQPLSKRKWTFERNKFDKGFYSTAHSNVVISNDTVYVSLAGATGNKVQGMANGTLFALNYQTGEEKWTAPYKLTEVIAAKDIVIGLGPGSSDKALSLHGFDAQDGKVKWEVPLTEESYSPPILNDGTLFIADKKNGVIAFDAGNGQEKWRITSANMVNVNYQEGFIVNGGILYFIGSRDDSPFGSFGVLYAVDSNNGQEKWAWKPENRAGMTAPVLIDGVVYVAAKEEFSSSDKERPKEPMYYLYAFDAQTGQEKWNTKTDLEELSLSLADKENVYLLNGEDPAYEDRPSIVTFDVRSGKEKWRYNIVYDATVPFPRNADLSIPAAANGTVYLSTHLDAKGTPYDDVVVIGLDSVTGQEKLRYSHDFLPAGVTNDYSQNVGIDFVNDYNNGKYFLHNPLYYNGMLFIEDSTGKLFGIE